MTMTMLLLQDSPFFTLSFVLVFSSRRKHFSVLNVWFSWEKLQIMFRKKNQDCQETLPGWKKRFLNNHSSWSFVFYFQNTSTIFYYCLFNLCSLFCTDTNSLACRSLTFWPVVDSSVMTYSFWNYILHKEASLSSKVVMNVIQFSNASSVARIGTNFNLSLVVSSHLKLAAPFQSKTKAIYSGCLCGVPQGKLWASIKNFVSSVAGEPTGWKTNFSLCSSWE